MNSMTYHPYLLKVLESQKMLPADVTTLQYMRQQIEGVLRQVYGSTPRILYAGSYGKDTMIKESFDLDIVIYFPSTDFRTLQALFTSVYQTLIQNRYIVEPKTVALRLPYQQGFHIDVVPGKAQDSTFRYATLYKNEIPSSTMQTSINVHIETIRDSGARDIIKLMKLWRLRQFLDWETFALEQTVIRALKGERKDDYANCFISVLQFINNNINSIRLVDPANSNNIISMSPQVRMKVKQAAEKSLASNWEQVIW